MRFPWWAGFLVLMIAGERLELSRLRQPTPLIRFERFSMQVSQSFSLDLAFRFLTFIPALASSRRGAACHCALAAALRSGVA